MNNYLDVKNGQPFMVMEVAVDPTYTGVSLNDDADMIPISKVHIWVTTPWLWRLSRGNSAKEWMTSRFWAEQFKPGQGKIVMDGMAGPRGHGSSFDPFWVERPDGKNWFLKQEVCRKVRDRHGKPANPPKYVVDQRATDCLVNRIESHLQMLRDSQGLQPPVVVGPKVWFTVNEENLLKLKVDVPALMAHAHEACVILNKFRKDSEKELGSPDITEDRRRYLEAKLDINPQIAVAREGDPGDEEGWTTTLNCGSAQGWYDFWVSNSPGADDGHYSEIDAIVVQLLQQLAQNRGGSYYLPLKILQSLDHVTNVYFEKMKPSVFRLDRTPKAYGPIAFQQPLGGLLDHIRDTWNNRIKTTVAAEGCSKEEAARILARTTKKTLRDRLESARITKATSSALAYETAVYKQQLWFAGNRPRINREIIKSLGLEGLQNRFSEPYAAQGVRGIGVVSEPVGAVGDRGGLDA